jgi:hypothetical protein
MLFTDEGIVTAANLLQPEKALLPIFVTVAEMLTEVRLTQSEKEYIAISVTPDFTTAALRLFR